MTLFKHYKGGVYELLHHLAHQDNAKGEVEECVVYRSRDTGVVWVRPHAEFFGKVEVNGEQRNRFKPITQKDVDNLEPTDLSKYTTPSTQDMLDILQAPMRQACETMLALLDAGFIEIVAPTNKNLQAFWRDKVVTLLAGQVIAVDDATLREHLIAMQKKSDELDLDTEDKVLDFIILNLRESGFLVEAKKDAPTA